jgi:hypothetical protein
LFSGLGRRWGLKNGGRWRGVTPQLSGDETRQAVEQHGEDGLIWGAGRQVDLDLPVSSVPARRRLLALMVDAPRHAKHSVWRAMQFDTLRLRLVKLAARGAQGKLRAFHRRTPASKWWSALSQQEKDKLFDQFLRRASERPELQQRLEPQ